MAGDDSVGRLKVGWARSHMPVLEGIRARFQTERPFAGLTLSLVLHVEAKTAALALALQAGGASVHLAAGNPLSTDDDAVAALQSEGVDTHARKGESVAEYRAGVRAMLDAGPQVIVDDGADLVALAHTDLPDRGSIRGSTEETTTGVTRLRALERSGKLRFPAIDVNDAPMKHLFDNRYGCGQSVLDGLFGATNLLIAGRVAVVAGYGWSGQGIASRLRGLGAEVIVTEIDPVRALEARLEGFQVRPMLDAARVADLIVTVTGNRDIVRAEHLRVLKDGCLLANAGHFDVEVSKTDLEGMAVEHRRVRPQVEEYRFPDGRRAYLIAEGRLVNLAAGQGHPVEIMDLSFALQALSAERIAKHGLTLPLRVLPVPEEIDQAVARAALAPLGATIDEPTEAQRKYSESWEGGT
ncbi:MAG: adenosylhomocysteinase [Thermoplasmata archaeon]|nr:adenosylhomocysteinase [Thermoplasmata archaeon]MCI4358974.1 adenosylhomocysteinase [Thermoplasmata archaeon]